MRRFRDIRTLVYFDGPQLFAARDQLGLRYLCLSVKAEDDRDTYICVPLSEQRLDDFLFGRLDLLSVFESSETGESLICVARNGDLDELAVDYTTEGRINPSWLPDPGFFLQSESSEATMVVREARARQRAVIQFSLSPPESREQPKIAAERLAQAVKTVQRVLTHAYRRAMRDVDEDTRDSIWQRDNYELEVFAFSPGSFTLHMQAAAQADMWGYSQLAKGFAIIDAITKEIDDPESSVQVVAGYGGHLATAYRDLLQFVVENQSPIVYQWAMPQSSASTIRRISDAQAKPVYEALSQRLDIGVVRKQIVGTVTKADKNYGSWRLLSEEDGKEYSGRSESERIDLSGIVIGARFEFSCEERLTEERGTGRETTELYLMSFQRA